MCIRDRFRVQGSGFRVQGLGSRVQGSSLGFKVQGSGFRVQSSGSRAQGSGFRVQGSEFRGLGFRARGSGSRVEGRGFRVQGLQPPRCMRGPDTVFKLRLTHSTTAGGNPATQIKFGGREGETCAVLSVRYSRPSRHVPSTPKSNARNRNCIRNAVSCTGLWGVSRARARISSVERLCVALTVERCVPRPG
eukprot:271562-Rhodomonas_salina.2